MWDDVVIRAIEHGLGGLECLSGIPGSAGATPVQNVGAYGAEVSDTITRVRLLDRSSGEVRWVPGSELGFGYRTSVLKHPGGLEIPAQKTAVVLEVEFALDASGRSAPLRYGELTAALDAASGERADPQAVREAVLALRARKGMVLDAADHDTWSVGSFFTNPVVAAEVYERLAGSDRRGETCRTIRHPTASSWPPAGWWSARASARAIRTTAARCRLSTKHALALTNRGGATAEDVLALARTDPRRGSRRVWYHTHTRTRPGWVRVVAAILARKRLGTTALWRSGRRFGAAAPGIFGCREHLQRFERTGADQSAPGLGGAWGRGVCAGRLGGLLAQIDHASCQADAAIAPPDVPAG